MGLAKHTPHNTKQKHFCPLLSLPPSTDNLLNAPVSTPTHTHTPTHTPRTTQSQLQPSSSFLFFLSLPHPRERKTLLEKKNMAGAAPKQLFGFGVVALLATLILPLFMPAAVQAQSASPAPAPTSDGIPLPRSNTTLYILHFHIPVPCFEKPECK